MTSTAYGPASLSCIFRCPHCGHEDWHRDVLCLQPGDSGTWPTTQVQCPQCRGKWTVQAACDVDQVEIEGEGQP